ncbi:MAG: hypothetical protein ABI557_08900, partial [Aureliella sp.]
VEHRWNPFMKCLPTLSLALLIVQTVYSDDLAEKRLQPKIEPTYMSETPGYLLLVFGLEASRSVWIVTDNEHVYIDRNSNGDLTDEGERVEASTIQKLASPNALFREVRTFDLGDIDPLTSGSKYNDLRLQQFRIPTEKFVASTQEEHTQIELMTELPHLSGGSIRVDVGTFRQNSGPAFATSAESASVVHFDGPLSLSIDENSAEQPMEIDPSTQQYPFQFRLGTKGLGVGSFAFTEAPLEPKIRAVDVGEHSGTVELRYCGANYCSTIKLPAMEASATLNLHISVAPFSGREIEPLQLNVKLKHQ